MTFWWVAVLVTFLAQTHAQLLVPSTTPSTTDNTDSNTPSAVLTPVFKPTDDIIVDQTDTDSTGLDEILDNTDSGGDGGDGGDGGQATPSIGVPMLVPPPVVVAPIAAPMASGVVANCFPAVTVFTNVNGVARIAVEDINAGSTGDNFLTFSLSRQLFETLGEFEVTLTVVEAITMESDDCTSEVTVLDGTAPVPECRDISRLLVNGRYTIEQEQKVDRFGNTIIVYDIDNGSFDAFTSIKQTPVPAFVRRPGFHRVQLVVEDQQGNTATCNSWVDAGNIDWCDEEGRHCNGNGRCKSIGPQNPVRLDIDFTPSNNGRNSICICNEGWEGEDCEIPQCVPPCQNKGVCIAPNQCNCPAGYIGDRCQHGEPQWNFTVPVVGDSGVEFPPGVFDYKVYWEQPIQFVSFNPFDVEVQEINIFGGITRTFFLRSTTNVFILNAESSLTEDPAQKLLLIRIPSRDLNSDRAYKINFPDNVITNGAVAWQPNRDDRTRIANTFVFSGNRYGGFERCLFYVAIKVDTKKHPDTCRFYNREYWNRMLQLHFRSSHFTPNILNFLGLPNLQSDKFNIQCTSCDPDGDRCHEKTEALLQARSKALVQELKDHPNTLEIRFTIDDIVDVGAQTYEYFLQRQFEGHTGNGTSVLPGSLIRLRAGMEMADMAVFNDPDEPSKPTAVQIRMQTNPRGPTFPIDGKIDIMFPRGWGLDDTRNDWSVRVTAPCNGRDGALCSHLFHRGEVTIIGRDRRLIVDMRFTKLPSNLAPGTSFTVELSEGAIMPDNCQNLNGWLWDVALKNQNDEILQWKSVNPPTDTCADKSVFIFGDPHFVSFSGGTYDVTGEAGKVYNIISDHYFSWNSQFVSRNRKANMFTYLGQTAFLINGTRVTCDPESHEVFIENKKVSPDMLNKNIFLDGGVYYIKVTEEVVFLRVPGFRIALKYVLKDHGKVIPHFDQIVKLAEKGKDDVFGRSNPHGLLGQTVHFRAPVKPRGKNGQGVIEGTPTDYMVPRLFATKWKWSRYKL